MSDKPSNQRLVRTRPCSRCVMGGEPQATCGYCNKTGIERYLVGGSRAGGDWKSIHPCPDCQGTGMKAEDHCMNCKGEGLTRLDKNGKPCHHEVISVQSRSDRYSIYNEIFCKNCYKDFDRHKTNTYLYGR